MHKLKIRLVDGPLGAPSIWKTLDLDTPISLVDDAYFSDGNVIISLQSNRKRGEQTDAMYEHFYAHYRPLKIKGVRFESASGHEQALWFGEIATIKGLKRRIESLLKAHAREVYRVQKIAPSIDTGVGVKRGMK